MLRPYRARLVALALTALLTSLFACQGNLAPTNKPTVTITAPISGSEYSPGDQVPVQSTSADSQGIARVELLADGKTVRTDPVPSPQGQTEFSLIQLWLASAPGAHTLTVRATNTQGAFTEADIQVTIGESTIKPTFEALATQIPLPTAPAPTADVTSTPELTSPTEAPATAIPLDTVEPTEVPAGCVSNAQFVADVTIPDGMVVSPGAGFTKTWRVRNNGSCMWDEGYAIVFASGSNLAEFSENALPITAPGAPADISIPMRAPNTGGSFKGLWHLRDGAGSVFGTGLSVLIVTEHPAPPTFTAPAATPPPAATTTATPTATPTACSGTPNDFTFQVTPTQINAGESVKLSWGAITNASAALLDGEGIPTPGERTLKPKQTTTYTLVASCGTKNRTKQVTVTVSGAVSPGEWFAGHWNIQNAGDEACTMDLSASGTNVSGTLCRTAEGTTGDGTIQGTASYPAAGAPPVLAGNLTIPGMGSRNFKIYMLEDGSAFRGSFSLSGSQEFCGWRDEAEPPDPCKKN